MSDDRKGNGRNGEGVDLIVLHSDVADYEFGVEQLRRGYVWLRRSFFETGPNQPWQRALDKALELEERLHEIHEESIKPRMMQVRGPDIPLPPLSFL